MVSVIFAMYVCAVVLNLLYSLYLTTEWNVLFTFVDVLVSMLTVYDCTVTVSQRNHSCVSCRWIAIRGILVSVRSF